MAIKMLIRLDRKMNEFSDNFRDIEYKIYFWKKATRVEEYNN